MSLEITGVLGLVLFIVIIWAIYRIVNSSTSTGSKTVWIVVILLLPVIGLIAWAIAGPKS